MPVGKLPAVWLSVGFDSLIGMTVLSVCLHRLGSLNLARNSMVVDIHRVTYHDFPDSLF